MSVSNTPAAVLINTPTFDTLWEDIQRVGDPSTPMITESEVQTSRSALFTGQVSSIDPNADAGMPSPISDAEFGQIINLEGAAWAVELNNIAYESHAVSPARLSWHLNIAPSSVQSQPSASLFRLPSIYKKLHDAQAPFWAAVSADIQFCLWAKMSQKLSGREPTKTLFLDIYAEALARQTIFSATWQAVAVTLDVPMIANLEAPRDVMVENALQTRGLLHVVEAEVITAPTNSKFILALMLTFTSAWVCYRSNCYEKAALVVLPHTVHIYSGLLPQPQDFTAAFRSKLRNLLDDHSRGWALLHEHPSALASPNPSTQVRKFVWFGNFVLREVVHRALYDPAYPGWFGFLEDVRMSNGRRIWAPLQVASPWQVGQVLGWIEELLSFHIVQANKAREPFVAYAQPPDNFTAHDSVIKRASRHAKFFSFLCGGTGEVGESEDPFVWVVGNPDELQACLQGYRVFVERPAYLPYDVNIA